ncbi:hypothetical protein RND71_015330 [Anisodus tanguticus]|uniref:Uncharacterized protein n=1 Tax=Anisodus tanguticus TaxID=243964 RepID=A0AAE1S699_9SOLA|nr:hypothetical protein RND71_015330 [Anisodus tanguticus]
MACLIRFWYCLILILLLCPHFLSRPLESSSQRKREMMMETVREIIRKRLRHTIKYDVKQLSLEGPDPKHH